MKSSEKGFTLHWSHVGLFSGSIILLWPLSMLYPAFRCIICDSPLLDVNFRCEILCFRLFIHSVGTKGTRSSHTLLGELLYLLCHFLRVNFKFSVLMSDVVMLYMLYLKVHIQFHYL